MAHEPAAESAFNATIAPWLSVHGWRVGRLINPFGHHWEIGKETACPVAVS
jgi:PhnB protein